MATTGTQKTLLSLTIVLMIAGFVLTISGAFSPAWQVVEFREFQAEHQVVPNLIILKGKSHRKWHLQKLF